MIDLNAIRAAAEAATPGPWCRTLLADQITVGIGEKNDWLIGKCVVRWNGFASNGLSIKQSKANAKHIATANPATVIALLDRLEAPEAEVPLLSDDEIGALVRVASKGGTLNRDGSTSQRIARAIEQAVRQNAGLK